MRTDRQIAELTNQFLIGSRSELRAKLKQVRIVIMDGLECLTVPLSSNKITTIDICDADKALSRCWYAQDNGHTFYACCSNRCGYSRTSIYLHRLILNCPIGQDVDHKNCDGLDNRRINLRIVPRSHNLARRRMSRLPSGGFRGVYLNQQGKFYARLKRLHLGTFQNPIDAAKAYNKAAFEMYGIYASLNHFSGETIQQLPEQ